jgi:hypothetical protein
MRKAQPHPPGTNYSLRRRLWNKYKNDWTPWVDAGHGKWRGAETLKNQIKILKDGHEKVEIEIKREGLRCDHKGNYLE